MENSLCIVARNQAGFRFANARCGRKQIIDIVLVILEEAHF